MAAMYSSVYSDLNLKQEHIVSHDGDDDNDDSNSSNSSLIFSETTTATSRLTVYRITLAVLILSVICTSTVLAVATSRLIFNRNHEVSSDVAVSSNLTEEQPCGTDANTARSLGCEFDPLTFAWLPPRCYDYNLTAEFLAVQDWKWWRLRPDGSRRELSFVNVMQGQDDILYIHWEYHRQHCAYMWLKMHRAMLSGSPIDGVTMLDIITGVCDGVFRSQRSPNDTSVPGYVRYPSCRQL